ncbi:MAG: CBS-domain-containing membrane protein [Bermanella sp.]|jgi:CBS-domain-containing membrane protein
MPFIMIDQGSPAIRQYTVPKQSGTAPLDASNPVRPVKGQSQSGHKTYAENQQSNNPIQKVFQAFEIMSQPAISLDIAHLELETAWKIMQKHTIKHLPITQNGTLNAIVSEGDILKALAFKHSRSQWLQKKVYAATEQTDIHQLAHVMFDEHIGCLPIVNEQRELLGMVTRSDILKLTSQYGPMEFWA